MSYFIYSTALLICITFIMFAPRIHPLTFLNTTIKIIVFSTVIFIISAVFFNKPHIHFWQGSTLITETGTETSWQCITCKEVKIEKR